MEITRRFLSAYPTGYAAYLALQCALIRRYVARGGTAEEFCERLAPAFHRRYASLLLAGSGPGEPQGAEQRRPDELRAWRSSLRHDHTTCPMAEPEDRAA